MVLNQDMQALHIYLACWHLKLSTAKTTTAFHLNSRDNQHQLNIFINGTALPNDSQLVYLGVTLDHSLTHRCHIGILHAKISTRNRSSTVWLAPPVELTCLPSRQVHVNWFTMLQVCITCMLPQWSCQQLECINQ